MVRCLFTILVAVFINAFCAVVTETVDAGVIRITLKTTLSIRNGMIQTKIIATNTGTDAAHRLRGVLHIFERTIISDKIERLGVQKSHIFDININLAKEKKGIYPFIGEVRFHDANQQPSSALSAGTFKVKSRFYKGIKGEVINTEIKLKGKLKIRATNEFKQAITMRAKLHLPYALTISDNIQLIKIAARRSKDFSFDLNSRLASGRGKYPAFCSLEYKVNGHHQTVLLRPVIKIAENENWFVATKWYWLAGLPVLVVVWIGIGVRQRAESKELRA